MLCRIIHGLLLQLPQLPLAALGPTSRLQLPRLDSGEGDLQNERWVKQRSTLQAEELCYKLQQASPPKANSVSIMVLP